MSYTWIVSFLSRSSALPLFLARIRRNDSCRFGSVWFVSSTLILHRLRSLSFAKSYNKSEASVDSQIHFKQIHFIQSNNNNNNNKYIIPTRLFKISMPKQSFIMILNASTIRPRWVYGLENCRLHYMDVWFVAVFFRCCWCLFGWSFIHLVVGWLLFHRCFLFFFLVRWRFLFRFWIWMMPVHSPVCWSNRIETSYVKHPAHSVHFFYICVCYTDQIYSEQFRNYIENIGFFSLSFGIRLFVVSLLCHCWLSKRFQLCRETRDQCNLILVLFKATESADVYEGQTILNHFQSAYY